MPPSTRKVLAVMNDGLVRGQEQHRVGHLDGLGEPAHRDVHEAPRGPLGVAREQLLQQRGVHRSRAERVDAHAVAGELHAELARHRQHAALGGRVGDLRGGRTHHRDERRGVDDRPPALLDHDRQHGLAAQVDAGEVDLLHLAPRLEVGVEDRVVLRRRDAGVVEGDVDGAEGLLGRGEQPVDVLLARHVGVDVGEAELLGQRLAPRVVEVADHDGGVLLEEATDRRQPDAGDTSGHDGDLAVQSSCASPGAPLLGHGHERFLPCGALMIWCWCECWCRRRSRLSCRRR